MSDPIEAKPLSPGSEEERAPAVGYVHTTNIPTVFDTLGISLLVSTYQAQRIMTLSPNGAKLSMLMRTLPRPTGIALGKDQFAVCSKNQIWFFSQTNALYDVDGNIQPFDAWYIPRRSHVTGDILAHEAIWHKDELLIVNTRFSCISKLSNDWNFVPVWKPKFISSLAAEDRCHLNGIAADASGPRFVTALGETDSAEGWREGKVTGGCIIDINSGETVIRNLCMPHSPRLYADKLWVLESGKGLLHAYDPKSFALSASFPFPGYLRGLAFHNNLAFVGHCKIREKKTFGGLPIEEQGHDLKCAIHVLNLTTGAIEGFIEFTKGIEEIFDIHVLRDVKRPQVIGFEEDTINGVFLFPSQ